MNQKSRLAICCNVCLRNSGAKNETLLSGAKKNFLKEILSLAGWLELVI